MNSFNLPPHPLGHQANLLAKQAEKISTRLVGLKKRVSEYLEKEMNMSEVSREFVLFSLTMFFAWLAIGFWEYQISKEMYIEFVGERWQFVPVLALLLFAILISALIAEPFMPMFTEYIFGQKENTSISHAILRRNTPPTPWRWIFFIIGIVLTIAVNYFLFKLSKERVELMQEAGDKIVSVHFQQILPAFLFDLEILAGVFLPFFLHYAFWFLLRIRFYRWKIENEEKKYLRDSNEACEFWDAYQRELDNYNHTNQTKELSVQPSSALKKQWNEHYGIDENKQGKVDGNAKDGEQNDQSNIEVQESRAEESEKDLIRLLDEMNQNNNHEL